MRKLKLVALFAAVVISLDGYCQYKEKAPRYFGDPIITDSLSTIFIPVRYNDELLSDHKMGNYYANIVVYNFKTDSYAKLFPSDIFIEAFVGTHPYQFGTQPDQKLKNITSKWIFMLAKNKDYNDNGRIDEHDPSILFATTLTGEKLKPLTHEDENIVSFDIYDKQGFVLIKIQRDTNKDGSFKIGDKDFYFRKIDLTDLALGNSIEVK